MTTRRLLICALIVAIVAFFGIGAAVFYVNSKREEALKAVIENRLDLFCISYHNGASMLGNDGTLTEEEYVIASKKGFEAEHPTMADFVEMVRTNKLQVQWGAQIEDSIRGLSGDKNAAFAWFSEPVIDGRKAVVFADGSKKWLTDAEISNCTKALPAPRVLTNDDFDYLHRQMDLLRGSTGEMPSADRTIEHLGENRPRLANEIKQGRIVLTGTKNRSSAWAYEKGTLEDSGRVITNNGVKQLDASDLKELLAK